MKTKNIFIIASLCMWFVLAGALSMSAKDYYLLEIDNEANLAVKVTVFDAHGEAHKFDLGKSKYKSEKIYAKDQSGAYYGFGSGPEGSKFIVEIEDSGYKKFEKEFKFTGGNMKETIQLEREKDVVGIPTSDKIDMKIEVADTKVHDQNAPGYPKPEVGRGSIKINFTRAKVQ